MHVYLTSTNSTDYFARRDLPCPPELKNARYGATYRLAHINMCLDMRSTVRAAGPSPDGSQAEVIYQVDSMAALDELLQNDPYVISGVWAARAMRTLRHFVEPDGLIDVCLDGSRRIVIVEAKVGDENLALAALRRLRDAQSLAVGGLFEDETLIAWIRTSEPADALGRLAEGGLDLRSPSCRSLVWVL